MSVQFFHVGELRARRGTGLKNGGWPRRSRCSTGGHRSLAARRRKRRWLRVDVVAALRPGTAFGACAAACCCLPCGADKGAAALAKGLGGVERRGDANGYVPFLWPSLVLFPVLWRATNAEFFVHRRMTPASLRALLDRFVAFHAEHGGRLELRYKEDSQRLYLDFSLAGDARYAAACRVLRDELGLREWTMHPSKAQLSEAVQRGEA